jgi:hypothetical protein
MTDADEQFLAWWRKYKGVRLADQLGRKIEVARDAWDSARREAFEEAAVIAWNATIAPVYGIPGPAGVIACLDKLRDHIAAAIREKAKGVTG